MGMIIGMRRSSASRRRLEINGVEFILKLKGTKAEVEKRKKEIQEENKRLRKLGREKEVRKYRIKDEGTFYHLFVSH